MATLTIRNLSNDLVERIRETASLGGRSMEAEVRHLLEQRYGTRQEILGRIEERWRRQPTASAAEIAAWIAEGRP
jgi:plasmid stability protein